MINIKEPTYATSNERMNVLRNMVVDGQDAEATLRYVSEFLKACEQDVLRNAREGKMELLKEAALEYKVAFAFSEMLRHAVELGKKKEEILRAKQQGR